MFWNNKPAPGEYIYVGKLKQTHNTIQTEVKQIAC